LKQLRRNQALANP
jgi:hypothetical protein